MVTVRDIVEDESAKDFLMRKVKLPKLKLTPDSYRGQIERKIQVVWIVMPGHIDLFIGKVIQRMGDWKVMSDWAHHGNLPPWAGQSIRDYANMHDYQQFRTKEEAAQALLQAYGGSWKRMLTKKGMFKKPVGEAEETPKEFLKRKVPRSKFEIIYRGHPDEDVTEYRVKTMRGYLDFEIDGSGPVVWILDIEVKPEYRRRGEATEMLTWLFKQAAGGVVVPGTFTAEGPEKEGLIRTMKWLAGQHRVRVMWQ